MSVNAFLDSNVILYAATKTSREPLKAPIGRNLVALPDVGLSGQVLAEFYVNATKAKASALTEQQAMAWVERLSLFPCAEVDARLVKAGIEISRRYRIDYWDGAILAAAERLGAQVVYTEDLSHGQIYGSVRVENPFL